MTMTDKEGYLIEFALDCGFRMIDNDDLNDPNLMSNDEIYLASEKAILSMFNRMGWQPIETAPKDRTIDLWVNDERQINCEWNDTYGTWSWKEWRGSGDRKHTVTCLALANPTHWREIPSIPEAV